MEMVKQIHETDKLNFKHVGYINFYNHWQRLWQFGEDNLKLSEGKYREFKAELQMDF